MDTIRNYLDNLFSTFPVSEKTLRMKAELLENMEEKYNELKAAGRSENEAIGIVISEFGNLDELRNELDFLPEEKNASYFEAGSGHAPSPATVVSADEVKRYIAFRKMQALTIALGVFLCILGVATVSSSDLPQNMLIFFLCVAVAVALFVIPTILSNQYKHFFGPIQFDADTKADLEQKRKQGLLPYALLLTLGIVIILIGLALFGTFEGRFNENTGLFMFLIGVGVGVFFIVFSSLRYSIYPSLLENSGHRVIRKEKETRIDKIARIYWPVAVIIYLTWSFISRDWHITWIVWPIAGIAFGAIAAIAGGTEKN